MQGNFKHNVTKLVTSLGEEPFFHGPESAEKNAGEIAFILQSGNLWFQAG